MSEDVAYGSIQTAILNAGKPLVENIALFDRYAGKNIPAGQISLAFRLTYRKSEGTLSDLEVENVHQKICHALKDELSATVREV